MTFGCARSTIVPADTTINCSSLEPTAADKLSPAGASSTLVLVQFWSEWCGACTVLPDLNRLMTIFDGQVQLTSVDVDKDPFMPKRYAVEGLPTLLLFKNDEVIDRRVGVISQSNLIEWLQARGAKPSGPLPKTHQ